MKTIKTVILAVTLSITSGVTLCAQWSANMQRDKQILSDFFAQVQAEVGESMGSVVVKSALFFLNTPYVGRTLEAGGDEEQLVINLRELDCTTFMENCVVLSRVLKKHTPDFESYVNCLQQIRYRAGVVNGYLSRLHYTTDWIADNTAKGVLEDVTQKIGGEPWSVQLSYMSSHPDAYVHLRGAPERTERIRQIEELVSKRGNYYYIPKQKIDSLRSGILSGDLIGFTTSIEGMDISHVAIACWQDDTLTFIHASSTDKKVIINPESIADYCAGIKSNTGIVVLRCMPVAPAAP